MDLDVQFKWPELPSGQGPFTVHIAADGLLDLSSWPGFALQYTSKERDVCKQWLCALHLEGQASIHVLDLACRVCRGGSALKGLWKQL
eukprot:6370594-Prorocentrum_lima.AAC.1